MLLLHFTAVTHNVSCICEYINKLCVNCFTTITDESTSCFLCCKLSCFTLLSLTFDQLLPNSVHWYLKGVFSYFDG